MGFLERLFERKTLSREDILGELASEQSGTKSGRSVDWKTAAQVGAAFACARKIADGLSQIPLKLMRDTGGKILPATDHPLYNLLARSPNEWQTSFEFREQIGLHLALCGNAYVWKNKVRGRIVELLPYAPHLVSVKVHDDWSREYSVKVSGGRTIPIPADEMWHIRGPSWDGVLGLEAVKLAREAIGLGLATEEHASRMFSNGAQVGGILTTDSSLKPDQVSELRRSWEESQGGLKNAFKTAILWGGLKYLPRAQPNDQAQLVELRRQQVEEICRHFGIMPIMVGHADKTATYASAEQMFLAHVVYALGPWHARVEQSADLALLTEDDWKSGLYFHFVTAGLLRGAHKDRAEYYSRALGAGGSPAWMTQDEVRALDELNPMGGDAAKLSVKTVATTTAGAGNGDSNAAP